ncbi:hypothetical protein [Thermobrachium celere]|uniref:hypothetical protein n=1 Tax=Thermobrachium celere TaxID=53422 RepID=UPI001944EF82|nr:hypothetical protein [Thermobrachium celere]GFR34798.1 hypothetical protein TCEA9_06100 [Thermobrachium celere]
MKETLNLFKITIDFLCSLEEEQLMDLKNGKAKLRIEYPKLKKKKSNKKDNIIDVCYNLELIKTREAAVDYLKSCNLSVNDLKIIAKEYNIPITSRDKKITLIEKIVEGIVGSKLRFDALLNK